MTYFIELNEDNRISLLTVERQNDEQFEFAFPADFEVSNMINYKIIEGELVLEPIEIPEPTDEPTDTEILEEALCDVDEAHTARLDAIEEALCELSELLSI